MWKYAVAFVVLFAGVTLWQQSAQAAGKTIAEILAELQKDLVCVESYGDNKVYIVEINGSSMVLTRDHDAYKWEGLYEESSTHYTAVMYYNKDRRLDITISKVTGTLTLEWYRPSKVGHVRFLIDRSDCEIRQDKI